MYYIFQEYDFKKIIAFCEKKFKDVDINLILKSLIYFEDVTIEPIIFKHQKQIEFDQVKEFLRALVKNISISYT